VSLPAGRVKHQPREHLPRFEPREVIGPDAEVNVIHY
jgi:hypothetical protein